MERFLLLLLVAGSSAAPPPSSSTAPPSSTPSPSTSKPPLELNPPVGSTIALMCEPVFSGRSESATWLKDGEEFANVTSRSNALLPNRTYKTKEPVPEVGFLIVSNIKREDQGRYECVDRERGLHGETSILTVAYVKQIPVEGYIHYAPRLIAIGSSLTLHCAPPDARPPATISWELNGQPVHVFAPTATAFPNGTLYFPRFALGHLGLFTCNAANFAGKTFTRIFIDANDLHVERNTPAQREGDRYSYFVRACVLWFLIGCLSTSCAVLLYLIFAMVCVRPNSRVRWVMRPAAYMRATPGLGPGFRKPIVPVPDYYMAAPAPPPPADDGNAPPGYEP